MNKPAFNRPKVYANLISDQQTGIKNSYPVYSMIVLDDFTLRTPDALLSGDATKQVIQNCCPDITNPEDLLICDIPALLSTIKIASGGMDMEFTICCPNCKEQNPYEINLGSVNSSLSAKSWFSPLELDSLEIYFYPPTYKEYSEFSIEDFKYRKQIYYITHLESMDGYEEVLVGLVEKQKDLNLRYQAASIQKIILDNYAEVTNPEHIREWFQQLDITLQERISNYIDKCNKDCTLPDLTISCNDCAHEFTVPIDLDFSSQFRNKIIELDEAGILDLIKSMGRETESISRDLLKLCWYMRGSVSYTEAYYLTNHERISISKIIEENMKTSEKIKMPIF